MCGPGRYPRRWRRRARCRSAPGRCGRRPTTTEWPPWSEPELCFDRAGNPITLEQWAEIRQRDPAYCVVCQTQVSEDVRVSTIWLGLDHGFGLSEAPLIFETMVFGGELDSEQLRYATEAQAWEGHAVMVGRVRAALSTPG